MINDEKSYYTRFIIKALIFYFFEICFLIIIMNVSSNNFDKQGTSILINDNEIFYYSEEYYSNNFLPIELVHRTYNFDIHPKTNIKVKDKYLIYIKTCEFYYKKNHYRNNYKLPSNCNENPINDVKEVYNTSYNLQIFKENDLLYNGEFIDDISKYISSTGRYYFHIIGERKTPFWYKITNHIAFNILVGDEQNDS